MADDFDRIKSNVQKMIGQNADRAKIVGYLAQENLTQDEFKLVAGGKARLGDIRMTQKSAAAMQPAAQPPMSKTDANIGAFSQGALFGYGDEMIGGIEALRSGFKPGVYTQSRDSARQVIGEAEADATPGVKLAGNLTTGIPAGILTGGTSLLGATATGAGLGGVNAYGETAGNDMQAVKDVTIGTGLGMIGGAGGFGLGKAIEKLTSRGIAAETIMVALRGSPDDLIREARAAGMSPAELDDVLKDVVRGQGAKNSRVASQLVPAAQQRLAQANQQTLDDVSRLVSPDNSAKLIADLQQQGQQLGDAGYTAAYANPARVGLVPELSKNPAMAEALKAAEKLAAAQGRPFSPADMGIQDLDAVQRALNTYAKSMFNSTPENTLLGPVYGNFADDVNNMAVNMAPELGQTQAQYASVKGAQEAAKLGQKALDPSKEFVEVAEEFAQLPDAQAQAAYRAGLATRLRTILQHKAPTADAGKAFRAQDVIEKLKAVGFPEEAIDDIIKRSAAPRGVLDALQGGSDTARKLAAGKASESAFSKVTAGDLAAGALVHPVTVGALPFMRGVGAAQERRVAEMVMRALTDPSLQQFSSLFRSAPQNFTPALSYTGATAASGYSPF